MSSMERFTKWFRSARQCLHRGEDRATFEINPILSASPGLSTFTAGAKTPSQEWKKKPYDYRLQQGELVHHSLGAQHARDWILCRV
jgi:hypothetical protein